MSASDGPRSSLSRSVALVWRTLRSMRTALILLLLLAAASVVGSLIPQIPNSPERVAAYELDHATWGSVFRASGFFDVFGSWWFALITALLFVSLVACLLPRSRALLRAARQRPIQARELDGFPSYVRTRVPAGPATVTAEAAKLLRRKRYRVAVQDDVSVAGEKGSLREIGSLAFHWAFLLLLVAIIIGKGTGYVGHATIVEGETWTDAELNYDGDLRTGRFFRGAFSGTGITLVDYEDAYRDTGIPMDFQSRIRLLNPDGSFAREADVRINHPAVFNGIRIYQYGFGWAAVVRVAEGARVLFDGPVVMGQDPLPDQNPLATPWIGVVKLTSLRPQQAIVLELFPDAEAYFRSLQTGVAQPMTEANAPFMRYQVWEGKLLDASRAGLDTRFMRATTSGLIGQGWSVDVDAGCAISGPGDAVPASLEGISCPDGAAPDALTMSFPALRQYSRLQISHDATVPYVLAAAILIVVGLLPALYVSRRKVWVRARPDDTGSIVDIGGFALQRKDRFDEEFATLVDAVVRASGGTVDRDHQEVGSP